MPLLVEHLFEFFSFFVSFTSPLLCCSTFCSITSKSVASFVKDSDGTGENEIDLLLALYGEEKRDQRLNLGHSECTIKAYMIEK